MTESALAQRTGLAEARDLAHAAGMTARPVLGVERVPLTDAAGRVLATPVSARAHLPSFSSSAMDGWAVSGCGPWRLGDAVLAGAATPAPLTPGNACAIATGAVLPAGAHAVMRHERGWADDDGWLHAQEQVRIGADVRYAGEEASPNEELVPCGTRITPSIVALAAAAGHDEVIVTCRPGAAALVLGDEVVAAGVPAPGRVRDVFTPALPAALARLGAECVRRRRVGDDLAVTMAALEEELATSPLVLTTGGSSHGPADHSRAALEALGGEAVFDGVELRPGHPVMLHRMPQGQLVLSLPGNPLAGFVCLAVLGPPLVDGMLGRRMTGLRREILAVAVANPRPGRRVLPCVRGDDGLMPTAWQGSAMLRGLAAADVLAVIPPGGASAGAAVEAVEPV
ncbi:molybdopterin molybdotransferase MoeA [Gryllotalpicola reticulitermitis]|uniref:Molybdopterin molybdenumtransferase n=1 Tax=Gryllotalpicola reticulitermitis TaxID=1184153 RepID=A0ABV8Q9K1_9MICO